MGCMDQPSDIRHGRRANFPGTTMCGLNNLRTPGIKFARFNSQRNCPEREAAITRTNQKRSGKMAVVMAAREQHALTKNPWRRNS